MKHFILSASLLVFAVVFIYACKSNKNAVESQANNFKIHPGDIFRIELQANPSTGYSWNYGTKPDSSIVQFMKKEVKEKPDSIKKMVGTPHTEIWYFKGIEEGKTTFNLHYARSFGSNEPAKSREYKVKVKSK